MSALNPTASPTATPTTPSGWKRLRLPTLAALVLAAVAVVDHLWPTWGQSIQTAMTTIDVLLLLMWKRERSQPQL
ncbi:hypothetical protein ACN6AT_37665 (plasmid) [Streptomyces sp. JL4002]|uniref:hypothetical protein n=1 Tax=Streptomyces sp. JL4002 TaxID=3404781 RepID=UPI003B281EAB